MQTGKLARNLMLALAIAVPGMAGAQSGTSMADIGPVVDAGWALDHQDDLTLINVSRRPSNYERPALSLGHRSWGWGSS